MPAPGWHNGAGVLESAHGDGQDAIAIMRPVRLIAIVGLWARDIGQRRPDGGQRGAGYAFVPD